MAGERDDERPEDEATVVVPRPGSDAEPEADDRTVVASRRAPAPRAEADDRTIVVPRGDPAPPVDEEPGRLSPELSALMFKKPLDPRRAVSAPSSAATPAALPKRGVRPGLPVLDPARSGEAAPRDSERSGVIAQRLGAPPAAHPLGEAPREGLPSTARANRRFRWVTLLGFAGSVVVSALGLWLVASLAFG